ncbi:hypothetical protein ACOWMG_03585 [Helicobacter pylori]
MGGVESLNEADSVGGVGSLLSWAVWVAWALSLELPFFVVFLLVGLAVFSKATPQCHS